MKRTNVYIVTLLFLLFAFTLQVNAKGRDDNDKEKLNKSAGEPSTTHFNINNISTWIYNTCETDINPNGNSCFEYPKGSNKLAIFESGFCGAGKLMARYMSAAQLTETGLEPGKILNSNLPANLLTAVNPDDPDVRIYRVRRNYETADLSSEINDHEGTEEEIRAQYEKDWNEWPAEKGAPYQDVNENGSYDPQIDVPGYPGADQTIWYAANDLDSIKTKHLYGSAPMGIEMQVTVWGYDSFFPINNMIFKKYKIINKSNSQFEDMYFGIWADPDVGDATDDFVGCDTLLDLGYAYNGRENDALYDKTVPSVGVKLLQGPIKNNESIGMSSFVFYVGGSNIYGDPPQGEYISTLITYNMLSGRVGATGDFYINPLTGHNTLFPLSGDPVSKTGFIDGIIAIED